MLNANYSLFQILLKRDGKFRGYFRIYGATTWIDVITKEDIPLTEFIDSHAIHTVGPPLFGTIDALSLRSILLTVDKFFKVRLFKNGPLSSQTSLRNLGNRDLTLSYVAKRQLRR